MSVEEVPVSERVYAIDGLAVSVSSDEPAVLEAMDLRLRDFRRACAPRHADLRFMFASDDVDAAVPTGRGRPVYETLHGSLSYFPDSDLLRGQFSGVRLTCDAGGGIALLQASRFTGRELYLATHPLATISLMELLERRRRFSLHAACVADGDGHGVLLAGPSGAGKSTLTMALARAGMSFLSDDVVFLDNDADRRTVRVLGFADAIGLTEHAAERIGGLRRLLDEPPADGFPKRLHRIEELFGADALPTCEPHAIVFPEVTRDPLSTIAPLDCGEALLRLVPDVLLTEPVSTQAHLGAIAGLLGQVRCYAMSTGADLDQAAALVQALV